MLGVENFSTSGGEGSFDVVATGGPSSSDESESEEIESESSCAVDWALTRFGSRSSRSSPSRCRPPIMAPPLPRPRPRSLRSPPRPPRAPPRSRPRPRPPRVAGSRPAATRSARFASLSSTTLVLGQRFLRSWIHLAIASGESNDTLDPSILVLCVHQQCIRATEVRTPQHP